MRVVGARYEVESLLGEGGSAQVFAARDRETGREVALKVFRANRSPFDDFLREARLLAEVDDPGVVRVLGATGLDGEEPTLVLERAKGEPIDRRIPAGREERVLDAILRVARVLERLHLRGLVHGDLKGSNVFADDGPAGLSVQLLDFGLAGRSGRSGSLSGDLRALSPERLRGEAPSPASDLWALGMLALRLWLGREPIAASDAAGAMAEILEGGPPAEAERCRAAAPRLGALLVRLLAADPAARPASAGAVADAALELLGNEDAAAEETGSGQLVGRGAIVARLRAAASRAAGGTGTRLLVTGPPGSGRSALLDRLALECRLAELPVLRASGGDGALALFPRREAPFALVVDDLPEAEVARLFEAIDSVGGERPALLAAASGPAALDPTGTERLDLPPLSSGSLLRLVSLRTGDPAIGAALAPRLAALGRVQPGPVLAALETLRRESLLLQRRGRFLLAPGFERAIDGALAPAGAEADLPPAEALRLARERRSTGDLEGAARLLASRRAGGSLELLVERAEIEAARGKTDEAARLCAKALRDRTATPAARLLRARATRQLAALEEASGDGEKGARRLEKLLGTLAGRIPAPLRRERALAAAALALLRRRAGRLDEARTLLGAGLADAGPDEPLRAVILVDLGHVEAAAARWAPSRSSLDEALRLARKSGAGKTAADAENGLGLADLATGARRRAARRFRSAAKHFRAAGLRSQAGRALNNLGIATFLAGDSSSALAAWEEAEALAILRGDLEEAARVGSNRGLALARSGEPSRGKVVLERALARFEEIGLATGCAEAAANLAETLILLGDGAAALSAADRARDFARRAGEAGRGVLAEARLRRAEALLAAGRRDDAEADARLLLVEPLVDSPAVEALLGRLAAARGDVDEALARFVAAGESFARQGRGAEATRALRERIELLAASGRRDEARELLDAADRPPGRRSPAEEAPFAELRHRLRGQEDSARQRLEILEETVRSLADLDDVEVALGRLLARALELSDADRALVLLLDERGRPLFRGARDRDGRTLSGEDFPMSLTIANEALARGAPLAVADVESEARFRDQQSVRELGLRAAGGFPIRSGGKSIGLLYLDSVRRSDFLSGERLDLLATLAGAAGAAIDTARGRAREARRRDLIASAAHELQTPAASVATIATLLSDPGELDEATGAELRETLGRIARRMQTTIRNILDLARLESDNAPWSRAPVDVGEAVAETLAISRPMASARWISLLASVDGALPRPEGDADRIVQVLVNLVGNAVRYSPDGSEVRISAAPPRPGGRPIPAKSIVDGRLLRPQQWVEIRVADRGPGVSDAERERIFEKFERGVGSGASAEKGAGLGLAISREIVRRHGGELFVEPRDGGGSEFVVRLPAS